MTSTYVGIVYLMFFITLFAVLYLRLKWLSLKEIEMWMKNSRIVTGYVDKVLLKANKYIIMSPSIILQVRFTNPETGNVVVTYVNDRDLQYRSWKKGDAIILKILRSDEKQCHYQKFDDEDPTIQSKMWFCAIITIVIILMNGVYITMMSSTVNDILEINSISILPVVLTSCISLVPSLILMNVLVEIICSVFEKYQNNFDRIIDELEEIL